MRKLLITSSRQPGNKQMLDFTELSTDGQDLELLVRELLLRQGFAVQWSGKGADGGRDLICVERRQSYFVDDEKRWLIQCKHNAVSGKSVSAQELDNIVDSCLQHDCTGYLLACSTYPSSGAVNRLEGITAQTTHKIVASYWDAVKIEQLLATPRNWAIAQRFFPRSASVGGWQIYGTDRPNRWIANYRGYYFHLTNRIGSAHEHHLPAIQKRVSEIEAIALPTTHAIRIRNVYYDDKNGAYTWYLDYMYPHDQRPALSTARLADQLGDGDAIDGQVYHFEVKHRSYFRYSDHHDPDHYDYYVDDADAFLRGASRSLSVDERLESIESRAELERERAEAATASFDRLLAAIKGLRFVRHVNGSNARIEDLSRFHKSRSWSSVIEQIDLQMYDQFLSANFVLQADDFDQMMALAAYFPQNHSPQFRLARAYVFTPAAGSGSELSTAPDEYVFDLRLMVSPREITDPSTGRSLLNGYFDALTAAIEAYVDASMPYLPS